MIERSILFSHVDVFKKLWDGQTLIEGNAKLCMVYNSSNSTTHKYSDIFKTLSNHNAMWSIRLVWKSYMLNYDTVTVCVRFRPIILYQSCLGATIIHGSESNKNSQTHAHENVRLLKRSVEGHLFNCRCRYINATFSWSGRFMS